MSEKDSFIKEYRAVYSLMKLKLDGHMGFCKANECIDVGIGFREAFNMLPKPPIGRKKAK